MKSGKKMLKHWVLKIKDNREKINLILFWALIVLNLFDLLFTYYGVNTLRIFEEGNCYYKNSVEEGNYLPIILHKSVFIGFLGLGIWFRKGRQHWAYSGIITIALVIGVGIYLYTNLNWAINILFYHLGVIY